MLTYYLYKLLKIRFKNTFLKLKVLSYRQRAQICALCIILRSKSRCILKFDFIQSLLSNLFMATKSKEEVYFAVCNAILKLEVSKGHLKWTISEVSRISKITRSLIYYYFGKEKKQIIDEAFKHVLSLFFNLDPERQLGIQKRMQKVLHEIKNMPYLFVLFYLQRNTDSPMALMIAEAERKLLQAFRDDYPNYSEDEILKIYLLELGSVAYQLPQEKVAAIFNGY